MALSAEECLDGFSSIGGVDGCYLALTGDKMTWTAAELICKAYNERAHLLVINSARKQTAISSWISASRKSSPLL